jgi:hypothetical protein
MTGVPLDRTQATPYNGVLSMTVLGATGSI